VPLIFSWPSQFKGGVVSESLAGIQDIVPTLLDLLELKSDQKFDGISLIEELSGNGHIDREVFISYTLESPMQSYMVRDKKWKYIYCEANGVEELYDMINDKREETNIYDQHPQLTQKMKEIIVKWATENSENKILSNGELIRTEIDLKDTKFNASSMGWRWY
jgi:arylsulfatase